MPIYLFSNCLLSKAWQTEIRCAGGSTSAGEGVLNDGTIVTKFADQMIYPQKAVEIGTLPVPITFLFMS